MLMDINAQQFFKDVIAAGAIIAGFCSTFLAFRIQRESSYYRQPDLSKKEGGVDIYIGLTHFTPSFLLIILSAVFSILCGFLIPLFGIAGFSGGLVTPSFVISGLVAGLILLCGYFLDELVHYEIVLKSWRTEKWEWDREWPIILFILVLAFVVSIITYFLIHNAA